MRKVYVLSRALSRNYTKVIKLIDGKIMSKAQMVELLKKHGHTESVRKEEATAPSNIYKGIKISTSRWGSIVWAKELEENCKLGEMLVKKGLVLNSCMLPVEKRRDK